MDARARPAGRGSANVGWRDGKAVAKNIGKNKIAIQRADGTKVPLSKGQDWTRLEDGDALCFLGYEDAAPGTKMPGLRFNVSVTLPEKPEPEPEPQPGLEIPNDFIAPPQLQPEPEPEPESAGFLLELDDDLCSLDLDISGCA